MVKRLCKGVCGIFLECVNWTLVFLVLLQVIILVLSVFEAEIPVPRFLLWKIKEAFAQQGLDAHWQSVKFDRLGHLRAQGFEISLAGSEERIARSESALMGLDLSDLTLGRVSFNSFQLTNATLFCPAMYSSSGLTESVLERLHCQLRRAGGRWEVRQMNFRAHNLRVSVGGFWQFRPPRKRGDDTGPVKPLTERYIDFCLRMLELREPLQNMKEPVLTVHMNVEGLGYVMADLDINGDEWKLPGGVRSGPFRLLAEDVRLHDYRTIRPVRLTTEYLDGGQNWQTGNLQALVFVNSLHPEAILHPSRILFSTPRLEAWGIKARNISGSAATRAYPEISGQVFLQLNGGHVKLRGEIDAENGTGILHIDSTADIENLLQHPRLPDNALSRYWEFQTPPRIRCSLSIAEGFTFGQSVFDLDAKHVRFKGMRFARVRARGRYENGLLSLSRLTVENPGSRVSGSFEQHRHTRDYRFLLTGSAYPSDLNPVMLDWWDRLWAKFQLDGGPFRGDIDVRGRWRQLDKTRIFAAAEGEGFSFRGVELEKCRAKIWATHRYAEIFDLEGERPEGNGGGAIYWLKPEGSKGLGSSATFLDIETEIDLTAVLSLAGGYLNTIGDNFELTAPPQMHVRGIFWNGDKNNPVRTNIFVRARSNAPLTFRGIPLDFLSMDARFQGSRSLFDNLSFGLAGGRGQGRFSFDMVEKPGHLEFYVDLTGADYLKTLDSLSLQPSSNLPQIQNKKSEGNQKKAGKLDLHLSATGIPNELLSFKGEGEIKIVDADLAMVQIFGDLSRLLTVTGIKFTTIDLDEAHGHFTFDEGRISFPELMLTGPHTIIRAKGDILMPDLNLDFNVNVFLLKKSAIPVFEILGSLLQPLSYAFGVGLRGTVKMPEWRITLGLLKFLEPAGPTFGEEWGKVPTRPTPIY